MKPSVSTASAHSSPEASTLAILRALVLVAGVSGFLVVLVFQLTQPIIAENKRMAINQALYRVIPGAVSRRDFILSGNHLIPADTNSSVDGIRIYAGYDRQGQLAGIGLEATGLGYQGPIQALYGYDADCQCISGFAVLKMAETPGIGDNIAKNVTFLQNFSTLDARLNQSGTALAHPIVTVRHGSKTNPWEIDAIAGATISSRAVGRMLNDSAQKLLPLLAPHIERLKNTNGAKP